MFYNNYAQFAEDMKSAINAGKLVKGLIKFAPVGLMALYPETERSFIVWSSSYKEGAEVKGMRYKEYWEGLSDNPNVRNVDPDWLRTGMATKTFPRPSRSPRSRVASSSRLLSGKRGEKKSSFLIASLR